MRRWSGVVAGLLGLFLAACPTVRPPQSPDPNIPGYISGIQAIAQDVCKRPATAEEVQARLDAIRQGQTAEQTREYFRAQCPAPTVSPVTERLHTDGAIFRLPDGTAWRWAFVSSFTLFADHLAGRDISDRCAYYRAIGANGVRVFGMWARVPAGVAPFNPVIIGEDRYFAALDSFATTLAQEGLRFEFSLLTDVGSGNNFDLATLRRWHARAVSVLSAHPNAFYEVGNENWVNGFNPLDFSRPSGVLSSRGRPEMRGDNLGNPWLPAWDYAAVGAVRADRDDPYPPPGGAENNYVEMIRKARQWAEQAGLDPEFVGGVHGDGAITRTPVIPDEPDGVDETFRAGRRTANVAAVRDLCRAAALAAGGFTLHSEAGLTSSIPAPDSVQDRAARVCFAAMAEIPAEVPTGRWTQPNWGNWILKHWDIDQERALGRVWNGRAFLLLINYGAERTPLAGRVIDRISDDHNFLEMH